MKQMDSMRLQAPAKINLSFKILARRSDSFHEIETLMAPISLTDELSLTRTGTEGEIKFTIDDPTLPAGDDNLVVRAARLFFEKTKLAAGVAIDLRKRIPHGAGLGGGSSDAAAVMLGLNRIFGTPIETNDLAVLAGEIGSDVPFFIFESASICHGRGELVRPIVLPRRLRLLLLKPNFGVPTPWAYGRWQESKEIPGVCYAPQEFAGLAFVNGLERPVFEKHLFLARMKMWLLAQPEVGVAMLSGSGSTVFAVLRDGAHSEALISRAKGELDLQLWTCACETTA